MPNAGNSGTGSGSAGSGASAGRGGSSGGSSGGFRGGGDNPKKNKRPTLLDLVEQLHFVEGQSPKLGSIRSGKRASAGAIAAQQAERDKEFNLRKKIKPIRDPDDVIPGKKKAARRKQRGRVGTTTLSNAETLG